MAENFLYKDDYITTRDDPLFDPETMSSELADCESYTDDKTNESNKIRELKWWYQFWWEDNLITGPLELLNTVMAERCRGMSLSDK